MKLQAEFLVNTHLDALMDQILYKKDLACSIQFNSENIYKGAIIIIMAIFYRRKWSFEEMMSLS